MTALSVRFAGIHFRGYGDTDEFGFWVRQGGWDGWDTPPSQRAEIIARANAHGTHDALQWFEAREVTQRGFFRARSGSSLARMAEQLAGTQDGDKRTVTVEYGGLSRYAQFRRGLSAPQIELSSDGELHVGEYEVVHRMADPRKYGETHTYEGTSLDVFHRGNFPAPVVFEIPNAPSSWSVTSSAGTHTITGAPSGGTHRLDMRSGRVTRNGVYLPGVGRGPLWQIPQGSLMPHTLSAPGKALVADTII